MTLLFMDGFDHYDDADILSKYDSSNTGYIDTSYGRRGTGGARLSNNHYFHKNLPFTRQTLIMGAAIKSSYLGSHPDTIFFSMYDGASLQVSVSANIDGSFNVCRGTFVLGTTATGLLSAAEWIYVEIKTTIDDSAGTAILHVNGNEELNLTTQDTQVSANAYVTGFRLRGEFAYQDFDDFYVCDTLGGTNDDFLGDVKVESVLPNGAGTSTDWTPSAGANYECVDENPPTGDTDYVSETTASDHDTYSYPALATTSGTVYGIQHMLLARKDDAGSRTLKTVIRSGGTDYPNSNDYSIGDTYAYHGDVVEEDPDTSTAWTISGVNAAEFGVELEA